MAIQDLFGIWDFFVFEELSGACMVQIVHPRPTLIFCSDIGFLNIPCSFCSIYCIACGGVLSCSQGYHMLFDVLFDVHPV
jgi:hypothetical protein